MRAFQNIVSILLAANAAASSQTAAITPNDCEERFEALEFSYYYFNKYNEFFHEHSSVRLYTTGEFVGPGRIQDYMYFAFSSPYFFGDRLVDFEQELKTIDQDVCVFTRNTVNVWRWNSALTKDYPDTAFGAYEQIFYNITSNKIDHVEMYYSTPFLKFINGDLLATPKISEYVCSAIESCGGDQVADVSDVSECMVRMEQLPQTTNGLYVDGNSAGCRAVHAVLARYNPDIYCAHLMFEPVPDPYGEIGCQQSKLFNPDDVFDEEDYAAFHALQKKHGIDPLVGYKFVDDTSEKSQMKSKGLRLVTES